MKFCKETKGFTHCCGAKYIPKGTTWDDNPGVMLSLEKPFPIVEGEECVSVETSKGFIHLRLSTTHKNSGPLSNPNWTAGNYGDEQTTPDHDESIQWYNGINVWETAYKPLTGTQTTQKKLDPGVGVLIQSIPRPFIATEKIIEDLGDRLIYQSPAFFNRYHYERKEASLILFIFETKETTSVTETKEIEIAF